MNAQFILSNYTLQSTVENDSDVINSYVTIENLNTTDTLFLHVERALVNMIQNHEESFCFGPNCYPPQTLVSSDPAIIPPNAADVSFHATLKPNYNCGTSYVHYRFFNQNNNADSIGIDLSFGFCTALGINQLSSTYGVFGPTRNPANSYTSFKFNLSDNNGQSRIAIYNMLGSLINTFTLPSKSGDLVINTAGYKAGLYLCSVITNNKISSTHKLVVSH